MIPDADRAVDPAAVLEGASMETAVKQDTITITFNGEDDVVKYHPHQKVEVVLKHALDHFGVQEIAILCPCSPNPGLS
jgi:hypothetical protein